MIEPRLSSTCIQVMYFSSPLTYTTCSSIQYLLSPSLRLLREETMSFNTIPVLDLSLSRDPKTKPGFLEDLRHALLHVGFLYISNMGIDDALIQDVITQGKLFFDLPEEKKLEVQMKNAPSFLGMNE